MSLVKSFDPEDYAKYDPVKQLIIDLFEKTGHTARVNDDQYGVDLVVDEKYYCEVEQKTAWKGKSFPYDELNIPPRKKKFLNLDKPTLFCVVNNEKTHALFVRSDIVASSPRKEVPNNRLGSGEYFYKVPIGKCRIVKI